MVGTSNDYTLESYPAQGEEHIQNLTTMGQIYYQSASVQIHFFYLKNVCRDLLKNGLLKTIWFLYDFVIKVRSRGKFYDIVLDKFSFLLLIWKVAISDAVAQI